MIDETNECKVLNVEYVVEDKSTAYIEGSKGGEEKQHTPVETPNNLLSIAYAKVLVAVAEGELAGNPTGRDIYLNGTPLIGPSGEQNFGGVTWEWRNGSQDQTYIQGMPEVSNETTVNFTPTIATPWVRQITKTSLSAARITVSVPALLQQLSNGDTVGYSISYAVDVSTDGGPYVEYSTYTITGKTNNTYERTHRINLPKNPTSGWTIRLRRLTPISQASNIQDTLTIKSFAEVVDAKQSYPNTALLFVQFDSRLFGGGTIPRISVKVKGRVIRIPDNYDPDTRSYSGVWSGAFKWGYTNNPAWVFYDIVTQERFGLGNRVNANQISKWEMYEIAQYCDVMVDDGTGAGTMEPRYTCNVYIQQVADAWQVLRDICSIFNGMTYWNGDQFVAVADKPEPIDNIPIFSRSNIVGKFDYQTTDERSIYTSALVSYDDPTDHYNSQVEASWERSEIIRWKGDRQVSLAAVGCTSRGEAQRKGKYTLLTNMLNRSVVFRTGLQGMDEKVLPGEIIGVADPLIAGKPFTGRLVSGTTQVLTLDRETEAKAGDKMFIQQRDGSSIGRTISQVAGRVITLMAPYLETPMKDTVWYLEASDLKTQLFKVTKVSQPDVGVYELTAVEYNESKFQAVDNGTRLEPRPISKVPPSFISPPSPITLSASTFVEQTMAVTTMLVSFDRVENAVLYEGQFRVGQGDWIPLGTTGANEFDVKGIYSGNYIARVRSINALGIKSVWGMSNTTALVGKVGSPPTVAYLETISNFFGIDLAWGFKPNSEDTLRTEIMYSETSSFEQAIKLGDFAYPQSNHSIVGLSAGKRLYFWCRLVDRTGNQGPWYPLENELGIVGQSKINDNGEYNDYFAGLISETALDKTLYDRIELIDGPANLSGSVNERIETVNDAIDVVNDKLDQAVSDLQESIDNFTDALVYDPTKTYTTKDVVRLGSKLYQAKGNVPVNTPPPNDTYWKDVGDILEEANALAVQVESNTQDIEEIDGKLTATVTQIEGIQAQYRDDTGEGALNDAIVGWKSRAQIVEERIVRADADNALSQITTLLTAEVGENKAAITTLTQTTASADSALSQRIDSLSATTTTEIGKVQAAINSEAVARTTADTALGTRVDTVTAAINTETTNRQAAITSEQTARVDADTVLGQRITSVTATQVLENQRLDARVNTEQTARTTADTALGSRIDTVGAQLNTEIATVTAAVQTEQTARVTADTALGSRVDQVQAAITTEETSRKAAITSEQQARVDADTALATRIDTVEAGGIDLSEIEALIAEEATARVDADTALATTIQTVQAKADTNTASIQTVSTAQATTDGKVNTAWTVKMEAQSNGQYVAAGIGLGIGNGPAGLQSQFLVRADRFAVVSGLNGTVAAPFVVQGGQVFISQALIGTGWITNAMIGNVIQSNNYVEGSTGWRLDKAGTLEINGQAAGGGRLTITNRAVKVYDENGVLRVQLGDLSA